MTIKDLEAKELDDFILKKHPEANFLQTSLWAKTYEKFGKKVFMRGIFDKKKLVGSYVAILKNARRGRYMEVPGGPIIDWDNQKLSQKLIDDLREVAKKERCVHVRIRPNIAENAENEEKITRLGLKLAPMQLHAQHTVMMDLTKSDEELMSAMRRQTRYEVRKGMKLGIEVSFETSKKVFNDFYDLQLETAKRQGFIPSSRAIALAQHEVFGEKARIYSAKLDGMLLCQALVLLEKPEAIYHEAASTLDGRKYPGAYILQWQIMQDAKKMGIKRYNLFGIAPPNSPNHRFAGVTTFKTGFSGENIAYLPAHDIILKPAHYQLLKTLELIRKKRRHL